MLQLIPPPLHRLILRCAHGVRKRIWRWRKPRVIGCRVLAIDGAGRVLLIRHSYGSADWMPPGGGVRTGRESAVDAAVRELREETGCALKAPHQVAIIEETLHGAGNVVHVVVGMTDSAASADMREVVEARFFSPDDLPPDISDMLDRNIPLWLQSYRDQSRSI